MVSRAELWADYRPRLDEAKKLDRLEGTLVFLAQPVKVGRFKIAPLTLERLLWLEALESPFVVNRPEPPGRLDVLKCLWVLSPHFKPGSVWRGRLFCGANICLDWKWYGVTIAELFEAGLSMIGSAWQDSTKQKEEPDPLWAAAMIDGFASQYGWSMNEIMRLPMLQVARLSQALGARIAATAGSKAPKHTGRHSDQVKHEFLDACAKIDEAATASGLN